MGFLLAAQISKTMKESVPHCMVKSCFSAGRLSKIVNNLLQPRRDLITARGWSVLLDVAAFSVPKGFIEWIICKIDPDLGEFRNSRNHTSILFNKEMVVKNLGLPRGTRPVVLIDKHEVSPNREFYKIDYEHGRRAPIHHALKLLDTNLDDETWLRTFYLVVVATYFCPRTGNMLPLEYLGSLVDPNAFHEYDWGGHIFKHTMSGIKDFQARMNKAEKVGNTYFESWVSGCLP